MCIPLYVSINNNHISFEHTHPPHEYILSDDKYIKITDLKKNLMKLLIKKFWTYKKIIQIRNFLNFKPISMLVDKRIKICLLATLFMAN